MNDCLVATMPKSGTWYTKYFFHYYNDYINGANSDGNLNDKEKGIVRFYSKNLSIDKFLVAHTINPLRKEVLNKNSRWKGLEFYVHGFDWASNIIFKEEGFQDSLNSASLKIVYLYRNPLDQAVSFFRHIQKHKDESLTYYYSDDGDKVVFKGAQDYFLHVGMDAYIKQFISYSDYPGDALMISYEQLTTDPENSFRKIVEYFCGEVHELAFQHALSKSSISEMKSLEESLGRSLGNDQTDQHERHVRDGAIGKWKSHFSEEALKVIQARFAEYGIPLENFDGI